MNEIMKRWATARTRLADFEDAILAVPGLDGVLADAFGVLEEIIGLQAAAVLAPAERDEGPVLDATVLDQLGGWRTFINARPALLSLLYDIDMLPEQTVTKVGAIRLIGLCEVWKKGEEGGLLPAEPSNTVLSAMVQKIRAMDERFDDPRTVAAEAYAVIREGGQPQGDEHVR